MTGEDGVWAILEAVEVMSRQRSIHVILVLLRCRMMDLVNPMFVKLIIIEPAVNWLMLNEIVFLI